MDFEEIANLAKFIAPVGSVLAAAGGVYGLAQQAIARMPPAMITADALIPACSLAIGAGTGIVLVYNRIKAKQDDGRIEVRDSIIADLKRELKDCRTEREAERRQKDAEIERLQKLLYAWKTEAIAHGLKVDDLATQ